MFVNSVNLMDFRNFASMHADFSKGVNIFTGNNANGKTNILESIYLCATTKSQKGSKDREMIAFGKEEAHIRMFITKGDIVHKVDMHLKNGNSKTVFIDGIQVNKTTGFFGLMYAVSFSPEDLLMIKNGPSLRRRFLDLELCQLDADISSPFFIMMVMRTLPVATLNPHITPVDCTSFGRSTDLAQTFSILHLIFVLLIYLDSLDNHQLSCFYFSLDIHLETSLYILHLHPLIRN
jgi:hypothetical protein